MQKYGLKPNEVVYLGDDVNDIPAFECAGYKIAPPNANPYVKSIEGIQITTAEGGDGVFREVIDCILNLEQKSDEKGVDDILKYE